MEKEKKSILYVQTSDTPEKQYSPLVLAQTAKAMDIDAKVYYLGQGLRILRPGKAEKIKLGNFPSVKEMIDKTLEAGVEILVCEASKRMLGWERVDLIPGPKIVGAATLNDLVLEADATQWF
jgi:predicted peroxiredoxin